MRTTLRTPVTPTRERLTWTRGRSACTSVGDPVRRRLPTVIAAFDDSGGKSGCDFVRSGVWWPPGRVAGIWPALDSQDSGHRDAVAATGARPSPDRTGSG